MRNQPMWRALPLIVVGLVTVLTLAGAAQALTGDLDNPFSTHPGRVIAPVAPGSSDMAYALAIQSDGKMVLAGTSNATGGGDTTLARIKTTGQLNYAGFGTGGNGMAHINGAATISGADAALATVIKASNGKIYIAGYGWNGTSYDFLVARFNSDGTPDTGFGSGTGRVLTDFGGFDDIAYAIVLQSDGKVVVAGTARITGVNYFALARYNSDGTPDLGFNGTGRVTTDFGSGMNTAYALALQTDGKLVAAGSASNGANLDVAVARYKTNGTLDNNFSGDGLKMATFGGSTDVATSVLIQTDGKIVTGGYFFNGTNNDFALARFTTTGQLDSTFSNDGKQTDPILSGADRINALTKQADGKIVAAGSAYNGTDDDFALARYTAAGALDTTFSGDGKQTNDFQRFDDQAWAVAMQTDGKIVLAGQASNGTDADFAVARYNVDGTLDGAFNTLPGRVTTSVGGFDELHGLAIQADGKIVAVGTADPGADQDFAVARYKTDGSANSSFGTNGVVTTDFGSGDDIARAVAIKTSNGKIYVAGSAYNGTDNDFGVARYRSDGTPDPGWGGGTGRTTVSFGTSDDDAYAIVLQPDGKLVVAGSSVQPGSGTDFAIARLDSNGNPDTSFSGDGKKTVDFGNDALDVATALVLQADGKLVVAGRSFNGDLDFALARFTAGGSLDNTFSNDGLKRTDFSADDGATGLALQSDGKLVAVGFANAGGGNDDFALARYTTAGGLDTTFSTDGLVTTDFAGGTDNASAVVLQTDGKAVVAGFADNGSDNDFALARYTTTGALDTTYSGDGKLTTDFADNNDAAFAVTKQTDGKIIAAGYTDDGVNRSFALARYLP